MVKLICFYEKFIQLKINTKHSFQNYKKAKKCHKSILIEHIFSFILNSDVPLLPIHYAVQLPCIHNQKPNI